MPKITDILEKLYLGRFLKGEASPRVPDLASALSALARVGSARNRSRTPTPLLAGITPGVSADDWPELPPATQVFRWLPGQGDAASARKGAAYGEIRVGTDSANLSALGVLLAAEPEELAGHMSVLGQSFAEAAEGAELAILGFDRLRLDLPGAPRPPSSAACSGILQKLLAAGWQLRGFRDCQVTEDNALLLRGAWLERPTSTRSEPAPRKTALETTDASEAVTSDRVALLSRLLLNRQEQVERYRRTDANRREVHRKLKDRLKLERRGRKRLANELKQHKLRVDQLNLRAKKLRVAKNYFQQMAGQRSATGAVISPFTQRDALGLTEAATEATPLWAALTRLAWSRCMRLGVLYQYEPCLLREDKLPKPQPHLPQLKISVVTPSYQQGQFLGRTMNSVLDQAYAEFEYLVLDGGSRDNSRELIEREASRLAYWRSAPDGGQAAAIAEGLDRCTGEIMAWLNSDDTYLPGVFQLVNAYFQSHPEVDVVYGHRIIVDTEDLEIGRWVLPPHDRQVLRWVDYVPQESLFWRRRIYEKVGGIDPSFKFAMDWDLLLRFQRAGAQIVRLPYFFSTFRVHEAQKSTGLIHTQGAEEIRLLRSRELGSAFGQERLNNITTHYQLRACATKALLSLGIRI